MKKEEIKVYGRVIIRELQGDQVVSEMEGENLVLNAGLLNVQQLLAGNASGKKMSFIGVGTNGAAASPTDTALTGAVIKNIDTVAYLSGNIVAFTATILAGDPAMTIAEVGLYNDSSVLVHRKVFSPTKAKVAGLSYQITYQVKVS